jgi:hypothetical protein
MCTDCVTLTRGRIAEPFSTDVSFTLRVKYEVPLELRVKLHMPLGLKVNLHLNFLLRMS